ncbi:hypothetical protein FKP32DRAFT_1671583 [Trametes sanguinea]|nr:hypothetical protein FKP32DRAFT_1671583 [Trametes sanguinea]
MSTRIWYYFMFASDPRTEAGNRRRCEQGFLEEGERIKYNHHNRLSIVSMTNAVNHGRMERLTHRLAELVAPNNGGAYFSNASLRYELPKALFLWEKREQSCSTETHFTVSFKLFVHWPFAAHQLALLLLHFARRALTADESNPGTSGKPTLLDIYYALGPNATYGVLVYKNLDALFRQSTRNEMWWTAPTGDGSMFFIATWPEWCRESANVDDILDCAETAGALGKV